MSHKKAKRQRQERRRTSEEMRAALAEQLASMIGCKRVAVTRAFRKLEVGGAVQLKDRRIVVKDIDALKDLAEAG
jgi:CRP-like cAMP-binding protein